MHIRKISTYFDKVFNSSRSAGEDDLLCNPFGVGFRNIFKLKGCQSVCPAYFLPLSQFTEFLQLHNKRQFHLQCFVDQCFHCLPPRDGSKPGNLTGCFQYALVGYNVYTDVSTDSSYVYTDAVSTDNSYVYTDVVSTDSSLHAPISNPPPPPPEGFYKGRLLYVL